MGDRTGIEWADATWGPVAGCTRVSAGCDNCYAAQLAATRLKYTRQHQGLAVITPSGRAAFNGIIRLLPERLDQPLRWRRPRRIFVNSLSDLFHEGVPDDYIDDVFAVMSAARQHVFQVLTKRPERMLAYMTSTSNGAKRQMHVQSSLDRLRRSFPKVRPHMPGWPPPNVWLGVSTEDQAAADERIPLLLLTPAAVRFISAEPLLGPVDLDGYIGEDLTLAEDESGAYLYGDGFDWVIVGGESGTQHRPMEPAWAQAIADQCQAAGVPVFMKQDSGPRAGAQGRLSPALWALKQFPAGES